jgi:glyoxylate utilization-related uncharacterized protein
VDAKDLRDLVRFDDAPVHVDLFETDRLWSQVACLEPNQQIGPIGDADSDAFCLVVTGRVVAQVDRSRKRLSQWGAIVVPAGARVTVTNASEEPAVVLLVAAPPPTPRPISE